MPVHQSVQTRGPDVQLLGCSLAGLAVVVASLFVHRDLQIATLLALPVMVLSWHGRWRAALLLAFILPLVRFIGVLLTDQSMALWIAFANFCFRTLVLAVLVFMIGTLAQRQRRLAGTAASWSHTVMAANLAAIRGEEGRAPEVPGAGTVGASLKATPPGR